MTLHLLLPILPLPILPLFHIVSNVSLFLCVSVSLCLQPCPLVASQCNVSLAHLLLAPGGGNLWAAAAALRGERRPHSAPPPRGRAAAAGHKHLPTTCTLHTLHNLFCKHLDISCKILVLRIVELDTSTYPPLAPCTHYTFFIL